jgi:hypothetical protein
VRPTMVKNILILILAILLTMATTLAWHFSNVARLIEKVDDTNVKLVNELIGQLIKEKYYENRTPEQN